MEVERHLQDTSGKEGQACTLSCQFSVPNVQTLWFKNGKRLEMKGRFSSEVKHKVQKLLIRDLKPEDQGRYTCRYHNLESSADLWVEGWYPGKLPATFFFPFTNLFPIPPSTCGTNGGLGFCSSFFFNPSSSSTICLFKKKIVSSEFSYKISNLSNSLSSHIHFQSDPSKRSGPEVLDRFDVITKQESSGNVPWLNEHDGTFVSRFSFGYFKKPLQNLFSSLHMFILTFFHIPTMFSFVQNVHRRFVCNVPLWLFNYP